jgi:hypothetical protein
VSASSPKLDALRQLREAAAEGRQEKKAPTKAALERLLVSRRDGVGPTSPTPVGPTPEMVSPVGPTPVVVATPVGATPCPECAKRREAKAASQARRRAKAKALTAFAGAGEEASA